ncbi:MAG TPA: alpha/beta hydrolase [Acidimicrobiales bacterium]|nr:alpha/beta hydrolase [Acidimicrobiales bacterium]
MRGQPRRGRWSVVGALTGVVVTVVASCVVLLAPASAGANQTTTAGASLAPLGPGKTTLTYCDDGGVAETLDVDEPAPLPTAPVPVVVYVHGGGWVQGDSAIAPGSLVGLVAAAVEAKGWVVVSIDYRLAPRFPWPAQIDDAACAIRYLRANAAALHIDPGAVGAIGDSAGGQIVSLLGLAGRRGGFDTGPDAGQSSGVQAVVDLYGPADLTTTDWARAPLIQAYAPRAFGTTLGPGPAGSPTTDVLVAASPVTYVGAHEPPFLIVQGDDDTVVPPDQSVDLDAELRASGNSATLVMVRHAEHGLLPAAGGPETPGISQLAGQTAAFLIGHLGPSDPRSGGGRRSWRR